MDSAPILAIDLGKFNAVFCWFDTKSGEVSFRTAKTTPAQMKHELTRQPVQRVVIEACSPAGWVHDLCGELGLRCEVANTAGAAICYLAITFTPGGFQVPSMIDGSVSLGQYNRIIRTNLPAGAGSQLASLSLPGDSFWM